MSATLTADSFIPSLASSLDTLSPDSNEFCAARSARRNRNANSLSRAKQYYIARSLASPTQSIPNSRLEIIRKLAWLLVLFQLLDGLFTVVGIHYFGNDIEGNPLIRQLIEICGANLGVGLVKFITILIIFSICIIGSHVTWLSKALRGVAGIYFVFALVPWSLLFSSYFLGY